MNEDEDQWADLRPPEQPAAPLKFATLVDFVEQLRDFYRRDITDSTGRTWCPDWWRHQEAVIRLEAMWRALENLRLDPSFGVSTWLLVHCDPHMAQLMAEDGPFRGCSEARGHSAYPLGPLPGTLPPPNWWTLADSGL